ncbi:MAG: hypothetical protein ACREOU_09615 [Candidatus Eiseniibacteriota bacterium]
MTDRAFAHHARRARPPGIDARGGESLANVEVTLDLSENARRTRREMPAEE